MKKIPQRTCLVTKEKCDKKDLLRVVRMPDGTVVYDETGKTNGKGAYLKKDKDVILKAQKTGCLARALEAEVPDEVFTKLLEVTNE